MEVSSSGVIAGKPIYEENDSCCWFATCYDACHAGTEEKRSTTTTETAATSG
jgi:hypothetical protein